MSDQQTPVGSTVVKVHIYYELPLGFTGGPQDVLDLIANADITITDTIAGFRSSIGVPWRYFLRVVVGLRMFGQILAQRWNGTTWDSVS